MASDVIYGPMQLLVIGFGQAALPLDFVNQLRRLRDDGVIRLVDAVYVAKDEHGDLTEIRVTDFSEEEMAIFGTLAGALFGFGAAGEDGAVRVWDSLTGELVQTLEGHEDGVNYVAFAPNDELLASAGDDGTCLDRCRT